MIELNKAEVEAVEGGLTLYRPIPSPVEPIVCPRPPLFDDLFA